MLRIATTLLDVLTCFCCINSCSERELLKRSGLRHFLLYEDDAMDKASLAFAPVWQDYLFSHLLCSTKDYKFSAPLACEGSIRLLRSAYHNSAELSRVKKSCDGCPHMGIDQIPFANDNCGTIRSRENPRYVSTNGSFQQNTPRAALNKVLRNERDAAKR